MTQAEITQEGIDEHLSDALYWDDHGTNPESVQLAQQIAKRFRRSEYGEQPVTYRNAAELMATWLEEES